MDKILSKGFLPYTGDPTLNYPLYYMARSLRVNLSEYSPTSENRRVNRKFEEEGYFFEWISKSDSEPFFDQCKALALDFSNQRFSTGQMPSDRFDYIFNSVAATDLFICRKGSDLSAYVLVGVTKRTLHFWFSFYDTKEVEKGPFGKWVMWKAIEAASENGLDYVYLGTCYGTKALYKARDFKGAEYFDGTIWSHDINTLKELCKKDQSYQGIDSFKARVDRNDYLERLINKRIELE